MPGSILQLIRSMFTKERGTTTPSTEKILPEAFHPLEDLDLRHCPRYCPTSQRTHHSFTILCGICKPSGIGVPALFGDDAVRPSSPSDPSLLANIRFDLRPLSPSARANISNVPVDGWRGRLLHVHVCNNVNKLRLVVTRPPQIQPHVAVAEAQGRTRELPRRKRRTMPPIQYSEKYFDDVYEYRCEEWTDAYESGAKEPESTRC